MINELLFRKNTSLKKLFSNKYYNIFLMLALINSTYSFYLSPLKVYSLEKLAMIPKTIYFVSMLYITGHYLYFSKKNTNNVEKSIKIINLFFVLILCKLILLIVINPSILLSNISFLSLTEFAKIIFNLILIATFIINYKIINMNNIIIPYMVALIIPTIILFITAPHMIGIRLINFRGIIFDGGYWNSTVISFLSINWIAASFLKKSIDKNHKIFIVIYLLITGIISMTSLSRIVILSILISSIVFICFTDFKNIELAKEKKLVVLFTFIVILFIFWQPLSDSIFRFKYMFMNGNFKNESRLKVWLSYLKDIRSFICLGYFHETIDIFHGGFHPHNIFLNYGIRFGFLSVILFYLLLVEIFKVIKKSSIKNFLFASYVSYLSMVILNQTGFLDPAFYIQLGLLYKLSISNYDNKNIIAN